MATGALPFRGDTSGLIFEAILNRAPLHPCAWILYLKVAALEKDRDLRFQHASEIRADTCAAIPIPGDPFRTLPPRF